MIANLIILDLLENARISPTAAYCLDKENTALPSATKSNPTTSNCSNLFAGTPSGSACIISTAQIWKGLKQKASRKITAIGLLHLAEDISPQLAAETIEKIRVRGVFRAPEAVKQALADRVD
jgi:hypothetical protein